MSSSIKRPDIFVSATSGDLGHIRELAKQALLSIDCHPVEQTNFPPDYRSVEEMLRSRIDGCEAVLHIVGIRYGAEPNPSTLPEGKTRHSYTQMEAEIARELGKKLYLFYCPDDFPYGEFPQETLEKRALQEAYRERVKADKQLRTRITSEEDVGLGVRELQTQIDSLRKSVTSLEDTASSARRGNVRLLVLGAGGLLLLVGVARLVLHLTGKSDHQTGAIQRVDQKLDRTIDLFFRERELLTKVLDIALKKNAEFEKLTPEQRFDQALRQIAIQESIPADQLESTLDIYAAKVKALGDQAEALDRVLVAQKDRQFEQAVRIADEGLAALSKQDAELSRNEQSLKSAAEQVSEERSRNLRQRYDLLMAKAGSLDAQYLYREAAETYAAAEDLVASGQQSDLWANARSARIFSLEEAGIRAQPENGNAMLDQAAALARDFLGKSLKGANPEQWADAQHSLGKVLQNLGNRLSGQAGTDALQVAREAHRQALTVYTREQLPQQWAMTQNSLGNVLDSLGNRLSGQAGTDALEAAREAYHQALTVYIKEQLPQGWAGCQNNLGNVLRKLGERLSGQAGADALEAAREAYRQALTVRTKEQLPQDWAMIQGNLGILLQCLGERLTGQAGIDALEAARAAFREALTVQTKEQLPQDWAMNQSNLGNVLQRLGERLSGQAGTDALEAAREAFREALTVQTKEQLPQDWAITQDFLGNVLRSLAERLPGQAGIDALEAAREACRQALTVYTREQLPQQWAMTQNSLGSVLRSLAERLPGQAGIDALVAAREAYRQALTINSEEQLPQQWATTKSNLGNVLLNLGERQSGKVGTDSLEAAREAYRQALTVQTKEQLPQDWARTQVNMGILALTMSHAGIESRSNLQEAFLAWQDALQIYTPQSDPDRYQRITAMLQASKTDGARIVFLGREFPLAEEWAREGLKSDTPLIAAVNLAHALLFQGKRNEALALYREHWNDATDLGGGKTFRQNVEGDFKEMAEKGLSHPDLTGVKKALGIAD